MSQILSILLALLICLQMAACTKQSSPGAQPTPENAYTQIEPQAAEEAEYETISRVWAAAEGAVRALPEADTVTDFKHPDIALVDVTALSGTTFSVCGTEPHMVYAVTYPTTADALLGPIVVYVDPVAGVLGFGLRE